MQVSLLRFTRKTKGLTLEQLSKQTGINSATLSRLENGKLAVSYKRACFLAPFIGWQGDPSWLTLDVKVDIPDHITYEVTV